MRAARWRAERLCPASGNPGCAVWRNEWHSRLKMADHRSSPSSGPRSPAPRHLTCEIRRLGAVSLRTLDHDPVLAGYRLFFLPPFLTPSVVTAEEAPGGFAATPPGTPPSPSSEPHFRGANGNECHLSKLRTGAQTLSVHCALLWWRLSSGGAEKTGPRTCRRKASQACRRALPCVLSVTGTIHNSPRSKWRGCNANSLSEARSPHRSRCEVAQHVSDQASEWRS